MTAPVELGSAAEVLLATDHDPFARGSLRRPIVRGWLRDGAVLWLGTDAYENRPYLSGLGQPAAVAALLADVLPELPPRQRVTLPRGTAPLLPAWVGLDGTDWDFRWTAEPLAPQPREDEVVPLDDDADVGALLTAASPRASALPGRRGGARLGRPARRRAPGGLRGRHVRGRRRGAPVVDRRARRRSGGRGSAGRSPPGWCAGCSRAGASS